MAFIVGCAGKVDYIRPSVQPGIALARSELISIYVGFVTSEFSNHSSNRSGVKSNPLKNRSFGPKKLDFWLSGSRLLGYPSNINPMAENSSSQQPKIGPPLVPLK